MEATASRAGPIGALLEQLQIQVRGPAEQTLQRALLPASGSPFPSEAELRQAGLRVFEVQRVLRVAQLREGGGDIADAFPTPGDGQSLQEFLAGCMFKENHAKYEEALAQQGLAWGDLSFVRKEDLLSAGFVEFHARRFLRHCKATKNAKGALAEGVPPVNSPGPMSRPASDMGRELSLPVNGPGLMPRLTSDSGRELSLHDVSACIQRQFNLPPGLDMMATCSKAREMLGLPAGVDSIKDNMREICKHTKIETGWEAKEHNLAELLLRDSTGSSSSSSRSSSRSSISSSSASGPTGSNPYEMHLLSLLQSAVDTWEPDHPCSGTSKKWQLQKVVGAGGSGKVILCRELAAQEGRLVVLKICTATGEENTVQLQREAHLMRKIGSHPHICQLFDFGWLRRPSSRNQIDGSPNAGFTSPPSGVLCMCLEYLNAGSLQDVLTPNDSTGLTILSFSIVVSMATQILDALECLHGLKIIHRDIKPNNIMLTAGVAGENSLHASPSLEGVTYKLIDLGIAVHESSASDSSSPATMSMLSASSDSSSIASSATSSLTSTSTGTSSGRTSTAGLKAFIGTSHWMSPEQVTAEQVVNHRTDLWSLGAVVYACLCGRKPFAATESDPLKIAVAIKTEAWPPLPNAVVPPVEPPEAESTRMAARGAHAVTLEVWQRDAMMEFLSRALAKEEEQRFQSATEMKQELLRLASPPDQMHKSVSSGLSTASTATNDKLTKQKSPGSRPHGGNNQTAVGLTPTASTTVSTTSATSAAAQLPRFCIDREFVQMEIKAARDANRNVITVFEDDPRKQAFFDYGKATEKYRGTEWEYLLHIDATTYRRDAFEAKAMLDKILSKARTDPETKGLTNPINSPGRWDFFLSHGQGATGDQVKVLALLLKSVGKKVWYDMDMVDRSTPAMIEGVENSDNFVLFLSGDRSFQDTMPAAIGDPVSTASNIEETFLRIASDEGGILHKSKRTGTMIYKTKDRRLHRTAALKEISVPDKSAFTDKQAAALSRMAIWVGRIQHPHVCACYDFDFAGDRTKFFIALEYIEGVTLETVLQERCGGVREAEAAEWMAMILEGLSAVHKQQCVHLGVTLSNIMLSKSTGHTKLIDFGLARRDQGDGGGGSEQSDSLSSMMITTVGPDANSPWGDPYYMSPEAWRGPSAPVDSRADIWSAGCCLFKLVSAQWPFDLNPQLNIHYPRDIIGSVLYSMSPAPDVRHVIADMHASERDLPAGQPMKPMSNWQVSDSCADCIAKALKKDIGSRFATAAEMKASLNGVMRTATKFDIFLAYSTSNEDDARRLYALLQDARPIGSSGERLTVYLAENFDAVALKNLSSSSCFVPLISPAVLHKMQNPELDNDAQADLMLLQCQIGMSLQQNGLISIVPVLLGDMNTDGTMSSLPMIRSISTQLSRATTAKLREFQAVAESCPRLARVGGGVFGQTTSSTAGRTTLGSIPATIAAMLDLEVCIELWSEVPPAASAVQSRGLLRLDKCVEKLIRNIESAKKSAAGKLAQEQYGSMVMGPLHNGDPADNHANLDRREDDGVRREEVVASAEMVLQSSVRSTSGSAVSSSLDSLRAKVDYTDVNVKRIIKDFSWFSQEVALAIAMASPEAVGKSIVDRNLARAFVLSRASYFERTQSINVRAAVECRFAQQQVAGATTDELSNIEADGLKATDLALIIDAFTRADLPPEKIESQFTNTREHESWEEFFNVHQHGFYACCMLACHPKSQDTSFEQKLRKAVVDQFLPMVVRNGYATGVTAMFRAAEEAGSANVAFDTPSFDVEQLVQEESVVASSRKSAAENEKLLRLLWELRQQVQLGQLEHDEDGQRQRHDNMDLLTLVAFLAKGGEQMLQQRAKLTETILQPGSPLARTAARLWKGVTDPNKLLGGKDGAILLELLASAESGGSYGWQALAAAAAPLVVALEVIANGGQSSSGLGSAALVTKLAEQLCVSRKVEFKRFAQIAVPEVAEATGPRFCHGGVSAERDFADRHYLQEGKLPGVTLFEPMHRLWDGERDIERLCAGTDANTRHVVEFILSMVTERPSQDSASDSHVLEVLSKIIVELQVTARLALEPPSADRSEGVAMLLSHINRRNTDLAHLDRPIRQILMEGKRDFNALTAVKAGEVALDHVGRAAVKKILDYINHDPVGVLSSSWPSWRALDQPTEQTSKLIKNHTVEWKRIAQLAIPEVAKVTGPRFCNGGIQAEKDAVTANLLERLETQGWMVIEPIQRLWRGERDVVALMVGCDQQDEHIVRHILGLVMEHEERHRAASASAAAASGGGGGTTSAHSPTSSALELMDPHRRAQLDKAMRLEGRTFMVAAKLAYRIERAQKNGAAADGAELERLKKDRERLMIHVYDSLERRGLLVGEPIHRILFEGERNAGSLTAYTDDIDTVLIERLLSHIQELHRGVSGDLWPSLDDLFAPPEHAARFIRAKRHDFVTLAQARRRPDAQRALTSRLLDRWEEGGWELRTPTEKLWAGVTDEHEILAGSDPNSQHVARAIMQAFGLAISAPGALAAASSAGDAGGGETGGSRGAGGVFIDAEMVERLVMFTGCSAEKAKEILELAEGDLDRAANMLM